MVSKGTLIVVHDPDLLDVYIGQLANDVIDVIHPNPLIYVCRIMRYPIQHAVLWPDVANENQPMREGVLCQLSFLRYPTQDESALSGSYEESLHDALLEAIREAEESGRQDMIAILRRHQEGVFGGRSSRVKKF